MKRWTLAAALLLPLPFAALPLLAVVFDSPAPVGDADQSSAYEIAPAVGPQTQEHESLGFRVAPTESLDCSLHDDG